ncbi:SGNH/GDSL hydrolase family protein [Paenibacillus sp. Soil750]|uniref:SGNH/GDSL hydrolase family protein n=1 Tax=Paenibacillus sp. Soil750 TaxID=1736398 RepID=UPI000AC7E7F5|nr:SGNH/GDSL hydrolase family protein [Paenibacillus sp. Soil750]
MEKKEKNLIEQYDPGMRPNETFDGLIHWYSPMEQPFQISGLAWFAQEKIYRRLPTLPSGATPEAVDRLANHTAGGQIRFQSDSSSLSVRVKLKGKANMVHMPATGQCGIDCYVGSPDSLLPLRYVNTTKYDLILTEYECALFTNWNVSMRNIVLNLPLYQGVEEIWIGLDEGATVTAPPNYASGKKVVIYGTSITQGGCASRPGMAYTNILSRRIPLEFINLGFSGSGKGEPEVAEIISQINDPACMVIDYEGNCVSTELFRKTLPEFIRIYRGVHPVTPILVVSRIRYAREELTPHLYEARMERKRFEQSLVNELREQGDLNIYFFDGSGSLGNEDFFECTVDGSHPTDLGFLRMADALEPVLKKLLL